MPEYRYEARELSGRQTSGLLTASSEKDALALLAARSLFPTQLTQSEDAKKATGAGSRKVPSRYLTVFYNQLSDLLRSGVPLLRSLQLLEDQTSHPVMRVVVQDVREQVADGSRLYESMRRHPRTFNFLSISMVRAGEEGGFLEDVLSRISAFNEHQEELRGRVTGAMVYPLFLMTVGLGIVTVMMIWFVPEFASIFARMEDQGTLPWATTTLLAMSDGLQRHGLLILIGIIAAVAAAVSYARSEEGIRRIDHWKLRIPGLGGILQNLAVARFCRMLGTLLRNGVPILQSLRIARDASGNVVLSDAIGNAAENVSSGQSLAVPLRASGQFSRDLIEMIAVGEEANNLEDVLINVADNLEKRTGRRIDMVVRLLEPLLLLVMAAVVTFVIAALLLPVMNMSSNA